MEALFEIFSAFGLSVSAGLNAYIPLLVVALLAKFTDTLTLKPPYDIMTSWWIISLLIVLVVIEFFADKIPAVNHINDAIQTVVRPIAGAIVFAASANVITDVHPILALVAGILVSGSVHAVKAVAVRPAITATTGGAANPIVSMLEDLIAIVLSVMAIVIPILVLVFLILLGVWLYRFMRRRAQKRQVSQKQKEMENIDYHQRRLPVYILAGTGETMSEAMMTGLNLSLKMVKEQWMEDLRGKETVWLSLIIFASGAHQIVPLKPLKKFEIPQLTVTGGHDLGSALQLLSKRIKVECLKRDKKQIGDFQACVLIFSDSLPTDDWELARKELLKETSGILGKIVTIGIGSTKNFSILEQVGDDFYAIQDMTEGMFRNILVWVNQPAP
jgi:uncharacterized protein YegL/uncharacterized membrane protein